MPKQRTVPVSHSQSVNSSPSKPSLVVLELGFGVYARGQESRGGEELSTFCPPQYEIEIRNKR